MSAVRVLIMAGGTGGHVFPALAVADELRAREVEVMWLGTRAGLESRVVPAAGYPLHVLEVQGLRGTGVRRLLAAPFKLTLALVQAWRILRRERPNAVLGMGGFVTGPGGLAAWLLRRPLLVHEQNAVAGMTNRLLAPLATRVMQAFPGALARAGAVQTGNPVREAIARLAAPAERLAGRTGPARLLVLGGSQGAQALNGAVPRALAALPLEQRPEVWHQAGARHLEAAQRAYADAGIEARVVAFVEDMAEAYAWADLVVCRSGALTVAELAAAGLAAILVPYPHAVDDHQTRNAEYLVQAGAAILLPQSQLTPARLQAQLEPLCAPAGRAQRVQMAARARALARPHATVAVAEHCLEVARG